MSDLGMSSEVTWALLRDRKGRSVCDSLVADDYAALLGSARGLALWHRSVPFCAKCGGRTESHRAGRNRRCQECSERFRPRVDPSVIVLVVNGTHCLLGRKSEWPPGRFSTLAGFVEFGETLEECVVREMREESGVAVDRQSLRFVASQPWLFPRSLMMGFTVEAPRDEPLKVDDDELEAADWFSAEEVRAALQGTAEQNNLRSVPSKASLARTVIESWLEGLGA
mmetsp:Transcript_40662/g.130917  ORF Transcript_40662/g.130917 Transcript_40662/m.130917 type:complete len:225 (+) Transcript_40662:127-801(+)